MEVLWTDDTRAELDSLVRRANARRGARVISLATADACISQALQSPLGFHWESAGTPPDARALTSLCLAVLRDDQLTVSVAAAHGDATPSSAWSDLTTWNRYEPSANRASVLAWAGRRREDRVRVPVRADPPPVVTTPKGLLARILAEPDDAASRLVFADLLSEAGDVRGEFISLQCGPENVDARARADELLAAHGARWVPHPDSAVTLVFARGFVSELRCVEPEALRDVERIVRDEPVEHLVLRAPRPWDVATIGAWPAAQRLRSLSLNITNAFATVDGAATLRALAATKWSRLTHLSFRGHRLGDEGFHVLAELQGRAFPELDSLTVEQDSVTAAGVGELLNARNAGRLRALSLSDNLLGESGAEVIAASRRLTRLEHLALAGNALGNAGVTTLANAGALRSLRTLDLRRNGVTVSGVNALLRSHQLRDLERLELLGNPVGRSGWAAVRERFGGST